MSERVNWLVVVLAAVTAGCGSGDGAAGMSGRQVVEGRDVADLFFADATTLGYSRHAEDTSISGPEDMWVFGLADAAPAVGLANIEWTQPRTQPIFRVGELLQTGPMGRRFFDFSSRQAVDFDAVVANPFDAGIAVDGGTITSDMLYPPIAGMRRDGQAVALTGVTSGAVTVGALSGLQSLNVPGAVGAMGFVGGDLALLSVPTPESDPGAGIYRLGVPSGELTELVPPTPLGDWVGTIGTCPWIFFCPRFVVAGCGQSDPPCPGTSSPPCAIVYVKADPDNPGKTAAFAYDVNKGSNLKLPGAGPTNLYVSPDQQILLYDDEDFISKRYWSLCGGQQDFCPFLGGDYVLWRSDSRGFVSVFTDGSGAMAAATFENNLCTGAEVTSGVSWVGYTPAGDALAFLVSQDLLASVSTETMFLARPDGTDPQVVGTGQFAYGQFSPDGTKLFVTQASTSSASLAWFDLTMMPPVAHLLASDYGGFAWAGNRRALLIDHWNTQDASGELALFDIASGGRQGLGRAVTDFAISGDVDAGGTNAAYAVHSRVASPRDGLWLTTLPP